MLVMRKEKHSLFGKHQHKQPQKKKKKNSEHFASKPFLEAGLILADYQLCVQQAISCTGD